MKALEIIKEETPTIGGAIRGITGRIARNALMRKVLKESSEELSEMIYQEARKSQLVVKSASDWDHVAKNINIEKVIAPHVAKVTFENPKERAEFAEKIYAESVKKAQVKYKEAVEATHRMNNGDKSKKPATDFSNLSARAIDALTATGIYLNVAEPVSEYFKNIEAAANSVGKPNSKGVVVTEAHFKSYAKEELGILVSRLAVLMIPFGTIGAGFKAFRSVVGAVPGLRWFAPNIQDATGKKIFYLIWAELMNSNKKLSDLTSSTGEWSNMSPKQILTHLLLKEAPIPGFDLTYAELLGNLGKITMVDKGAEFIPTAPYEALKSLYDSAVQKYTEFFGKQGKKVDPNTLEPQSQPAPKTPAQAPPAPQATGQGTFNSADWVKTPSGFYQNKKDNSMMSPDEYNERVGWIPK